MIATGIVVAGIGSLAVATALELRAARHPAEVFLERRLDFPVTYWNGVAAFFLIAFWPAIALAGERRLPVVLRAAALAAATEILACAVMAQSKGGTIAVALSGLVFFGFSRSRLRALVPTAIAGALTGAATPALTDP